jgi:hypothetical protein
MQFLAQGLLIGTFFLKHTVMPDVHAANAE